MSTAAEYQRLNPALADLLAEHSPQLVITRPTLVPAPSSPTGWMLVIPEAQR